MKKRILIREDDNRTLIAEWYPLQTGMPIVGYGSTVLEAIGSLVLYDGIIELESTPFINTKFSVKEPDSRKC